MLSKYVSAFALTATLGVFAGCSDSPDSYAGSEEEEFPAPNQSTMDESQTGTDPGATDSQMAGSQTESSEQYPASSGQDSGAYGDDSESVAGSQSGDSSMMEEDSTGSDAVARSEFAAFDTNSDGELSQQEWESDALQNQVDLKNRTFEQLDRNGSGALEPEEYQNAKVSQTQGQTSGGALEQRRSE